MERASIMTAPSTIGPLLARECTNQATRVVVSFPMIPLLAIYLLANPTVTTGALSVPLRNNNVNRVVSQACMCSFEMQMVYCEQDKMVGGGSRMTECGCVQYQVFLSCAKPSNCCLREGLFVCCFKTYLLCVS